MSSSWRLSHLNELEEKGNPQSVGFLVLDALSAYLFSNILSIVALAVSISALGVSLNSHRFQSHASLITEVTGDWNFDYSIEKSNRPSQTEYLLSNKGLLGQTSVENHGGMKTTLKQIELQKKGSTRYKTLRRYKTVATLAKKGESDPALGLPSKLIGIFSEGIRSLGPDFSNIEVRPGDTVSLSISQRHLLQRLWKEKIVGEGRGEGLYRLLVKHTLGKAKSNDFRIVTSASTLDYLRVNLDEKRFYEMSQLVNPSGSP